MSDNNKEKEKADFQTDYRKSSNYTTGEAADNFDVAGDGKLKKSDSTEKDTNVQETVDEVIKEAKDK